MAQPCDLYRVARQCGVILRDGKDHSPTSNRPRHCFCKPTLKAIGQAHGEAHLALVLRLIVESKGNAAELHSATIKAVSAVVECEFIQIGTSLFEAFDRIDLRLLRLWAYSARRYNKSSSVADAMTTALLWQLDKPRVVAA
jgi:hypothetical protein